MTKALNKTQQVAQVICGGRGYHISINRVVEKTNLEHKSAIRILRTFAKQGFLELSHEKTKKSRKGVSHLPKRFPVWKILNRKKIYGTVACPGRNGKGQIRDLIWKAIRIKRIFTVKYIMALTGKQEETIHNFLAILKKHNLLRQAGRTGLCKNWHLIMPNPPVKRPDLEEAKKKVWKKKGVLK